VDPVMTDRTCPRSSISAPPQGPAGSGEAGGLGPQCPRTVEAMMLRTLREGYRLLREAALEFAREDPFTQAGALSYYTIFSLAPFLLLLVAIVGLVYGEEAARGEVVERLSDLVGSEAASLAQDILARAHAAGGGVL